MSTDRCASNFSVVHNIDTYLVCLFFFTSSLIEHFGGKQLVMQLLSHEDPNVRYEALVAVQKLMVHNWYVLNKIKYHRPNNGTVTISLNSFREYLGKQLQKEDDSSNQVSNAGPATIQGKA